MQIDLEKAKKYALILSGVLLLCVFLFAIKFVFNLVGDPTRADAIYTQALRDFEEKNYSNAYFQFSKVSYLSDLKPFAIYHRAECAKALNDFKSEQKQYYLLFNVYPQNELALRAKYLYATDLADSSPKLAQKLFEEIIKKHPETDYALGSKYQLATLLNAKYANTLTSNLVEKKEIETLLRDYLTKAPSGRWALRAAELWLSINPNLTSEDKNLVAETFISYNLLARADELLENSDLNITWAKRAKVAILEGKYGKAKSLIETGLKQSDSKVSETEKRQVIARYLQTQRNKSYAMDNLLHSSDPNDIFLKMQKCKYTSNANTAKICYANILKQYKVSEFSENDLAELFIQNITNNQSSNAKTLGNEYLKRFSTGQNRALVTYWLGRIAKAQNNTVQANEHFRNVIVNFPDSYYAFRSYLQLNNIKNSIITTQIEPKEVIFPYYGQTTSTIIKLVEYNDYEILGQIYENDKFVQSWILYEKGDKSRAMCMARDAMQQLNDKPDKTDLRWRLVYPTFMYEDMTNHAKTAGNNPVLMLALTREESYFNPNAQSYVGAVGLMQLMPATAKEINRIKGLGMQSLSELKDSDTNMKLGNHYYNFLLNNLGQNNILAVASYNGGIGSINRWKEGLVYRDIDEFVEKIPYPETRNYVKKVFRTYWNYARIYL